MKNSQNNNQNTPRLGRSSASSHKRPMGIQPGGKRGPLKSKKELDEETWIEREVEDLDALEDDFDA